MIYIKHKGGFKNTERYLNRIRSQSVFDNIESYAQEGLRALIDSTPKDTGTTANSWYYKIIRTNDTVSIEYRNSNINDNVQIAIILQYGHGTKNGGWVEGMDYINPSIRPVFEKISNDAWKEVTK